MRVSLDRLLKTLQGKLCSISEHLLLTCAVGEKAPWLLQSYTQVILGPMILLSLPPFFPVVYLQLPKHKWNPKSGTFLYYVVLYCLSNHLL